jgi:hypothetical protein
MAVKNVKVNIDINNNLKSVEDLKLELRALEAEFETVSVGSTKFNELGNTIKKTRSQLKDIELQFEGLDKEQRATALVDTFQGLVGAVGAVSSAFIAFGGESKAIDEAEKKLLGVIGVVNGLRDVSNSLVAAGKLLGPTFTSIGNQIQAGFTAGATGAQTFKAALISTGIGAFVVVVGLLVDALIESASAAGDAEEATKRFGDTLAGLNRQFSVERTNVVETLNTKLKSAELEGKSIEEIADLRDKAFADQIDIANREVKALNDARSRRQKEISDQEKDSKKRLEIIKKEFGEGSAFQQASFRLGDELTKLEAQRDQNTIDLQIKQQEKRKKLAEDRKKFLIDTEKDLIAALQQLRLTEAKTDEEIARVTLANELANLETARKAKVAEANKLGLDIFKINQTYDALNEEARNKFNDTIAKIDKAAADKRFADRQAADEKELNSIDSYYSRLLTGVEQVVDDIAVTQNILSEKQFEDINTFITKALGQTTEVLNKQNQELENAGDKQNQILKQRSEARLRLTVTLLEDEQLKRKAVFDKQLQDESLTEEQRKVIQEAAAADFQAFQDRKKAAIEKTAREIIAIDNETTQAQKDNTLSLIQFTQQSFTDLFSVLRDLNEANAGASEAEQRKAFEQNKNFATAEAVINTLLTVTRIFANAAANPKSVLFPAQPYIEAGIAAATGFATVAKIRSAQFGGAGGGGSSAGGSAGSVSGGGGGSNILNPFASEGGGTNVLPPRLAPPGGGKAGEQIGTGEQGVGNVPIVRAYVLAGDVTDAQTADAKLNQKRQF